MVFEMILSAKTSSKIAIDMCAVWVVAPSLKVGSVKLIFFQSHNERIHNNITVPLGVERLHEKDIYEYAPTRRSNPTPIFLSYFLQIYKLVEKNQKTSLKNTHLHVLCAGECFVTVL